MKNKPRLAIISPFLDKQHGTERRVVEEISHLTETFETHIYSQRVEDLDLSKVVWHRIPKLPGPHLFDYIWWFMANHIWRRFDRAFRGLNFDIVFSPGVNCLDADVISVHILFIEYIRDFARDCILRKTLRGYGPESCTADCTTLSSSSWNARFMGTRIQR